MITIHMYEEYSNTSYYSAPELCEYHSVIYIYMNISELSLGKALARFQNRYKCVVFHTVLPVVLPGDRCPVDTARSMQLNSSIGVVIVVVNVEGSCNSRSASFSDVRVL